MKLSKVVSGLGVVAAAVGTGALGRQLVRGIGASVQASRTFEASLSRVRGLTQASAGDMAALSQQAKDLGRTTVFSNAEAADAMAEFAKAGFNVREIAESIGPTLSLAAAGQLELAQASSITAVVMRSMGKDTDDLTSVVDLLAKTATSANTTIAEIGDAWKYVGATGFATGVTLKDILATMGALANAGIPAEQSATQLRNLFLELKKSTKDNITTLGKFKVELFDSKGAFVGITEALDRMSAAGINQNNIASIFEKRLAGTMLAAFAQRDAIAELRGELDKAGGSAERLANEYLDNLDGAMVRLESATRVLKTEIGEDFQQVLKTLIDSGLNPLINEITEAWQKSNRLEKALIDTALAAAMFGRSIESVVRSPAVQVGFTLIMAKLDDDLRRARIGLAITGAVIDVELQKMFRALGGLGETPTFDKLIADLNALRVALAQGDEGGDGDKGAGGYNAASDAAAGYEEKVKTILPLVPTMDEQVRAFVENGVTGLEALAAKVAETGGHMEGLGTTIQRSVRDVGVSSALAFGDALVGAAFEGELQFDKFMKNLIQDLMTAIVQAVLLETILGVTGLDRFLGRVLGHKKGGVVGGGSPARPFIGSLPEAQSGYLVAGGTPGRDSVLISAQRGEAVLPAELTRFLLAGARSVTSADGGAGASGGGGRPVVVNYSINAMDGTDVRRVLMKHHEQLADAVRLAANRRTL